MKTGFNEAASALPQDTQRNHKPFKGNVAAANHERRTYLAG